MPAKRRDIFDTALVLLSIASSFVAVYLISQDPEFLNLASLSCGHHHHHHEDLSLIHI